MKYLLIDVHNLAHRCKHLASGDIDMKIGMTFSIMFNSIKKLWSSDNHGHVVFCFDGSSWRKEIYAPYKRSTNIIANKSLSEIEDDDIFFEALDDMRDFLTRHTNSTVLYNEILEADDLISFWISEHPNEEHVIVSTDTDFLQLLSNSNVSIYNGADKRYITQRGVFTEKNEPLHFTVKSNGKLSVGHVDKTFVPDADWYEWATFLKYVRGDSSDMIFPAYPGAYVKSTSKRIGIREAYDDRHNKGYAWNNFMLQRWTDENGSEHVVKDKIRENTNLINLTAQPKEIKQVGKETIHEAIGKNRISNVGIHFMQFCTKWDLSRIVQAPTAYASILNTGYIAS